MESTGIVRLSAGGVKRRMYDDDDCCGGICASPPCCCQPQGQCCPPIGQLQSCDSPADANNSARTRRYDASSTHRHAHQNSATHRHKSMKIEDLPANAVIAIGGETYVLPSRSNQGQSGAQHARRSSEAQDPVEYCLSNARRVMDDDCCPPPCCPPPCCPTGPPCAAGCSLPAPCTCCDAPASAGAEQQMSRQQQQSSQVQAKTADVSKANSGPFNIFDDVVPRTGRRTVLGSQSRFVRHRAAAPQRPSAHMRYRSHGRH